MAEARILTAAEMADLLQLNIEAVRTAFQRGELPGFEVMPGHLRCSEPAFYEWADRRSREARDGKTPPSPADAAELAFGANHREPAFSVMAARGGTLEQLQGRELATPDNRRSRPFRLDAIDGERGGLLVSPLGNRNASPVFIRAAAVDRCLYYLDTQVAPGAFTPIQASQNHPGPLARFTRRGNGGVRCLHYLLPILAAAGQVEIDGDSRPNTVRRCSTADGDDRR